MDIKENSLDELKVQFEKLFPGQKIPNNKVLLFRKISYKLQELEFGSLSAEAKAKLDELIKKYDPTNNIYIRPENDPDVLLGRPNQFDRRLPIPGSVITKNYKGQKIQVKVLENGFEYNGEIYRSLSAIATLLGGVHWNGYTFFGL